MNKKIRSVSFFLIAVLAPFFGFAQYTISGRVLNKADGKPVANASVFLSNATIGGTTAGNGAFVLSNVPGGKYQLVVSIVGFETYSQTILLTGNIDLHDIAISPKTISLQEVSIQGDRKRADNFDVLYDIFKREFFGQGEFADYCKILNPQLLDLNYDDTSGQLIGSSVDFLNIENDALGYKIKYLLTAFSFDRDARDIHYEGPVAFTEMKGTAGQERRWERNRRQAYEGSMVSFVRAAMNGTLNEDGFKAYRISTYLNPARPSEEIIAVKLKKFDVKKDAPDYNSDSLSYWRKKEALPKMITTLVPLGEEGIIVPAQQPGQFVLGRGDGNLLVDFSENHHFIETKSLADLGNLAFVLNKPGNKEITQLQFDTVRTIFDGNGTINDPNNVLLKGALGDNRVAELLPVNYGESTNVLSAGPLVKSIESKADAFATTHLTEKVHLHLDRPWYDLGDTIWFKAYAVSGAAHQLSALSGVLYAELITPGDTVLQRLTLQLDSGLSHGRFVIPYTCKSGLYHIRAYTNWMRNDSDYFYKRDILIGGLGPEQETINPKLVKKINISPQPAAETADVQFFPEGGYLVNGLRSKVAFKAISRNGMATVVSGAITDQDDNEAAMLRTQYAGMGQFPLTPQAGKQYRAKITCADGSSYVLNLPQAKEEGFTLAVNNAQPDSIYVTVAASESLYKSNPAAAFYLLGQSGGKCYFAAAGKLSERVFSTTIAKSRFPSGIVRFTLFSQNGEPMNERAVFIQNNDQLNLAITAEKESYKPLEKVKLALTAKDPEDKMVSGTFSVAVTDETQVPVDEQSEPTIFTDLLLASDLKGNIENPGHYFTAQNDETRSDLDLLMLTQGYSRYEWKKVLAANPETPKYKPETLLSLSGIIKTPSGKPIPHGRIRLTSVKDLFSADTLSDANGNFRFTNLYLNDSTKVVINAKKANGGDNVNITIRRPRYPAIARTTQAANAAIDTTASEQLLTALKKAYVAGKAEYLKHAVMLKEVQIKDHRNTFFNPVYSDNMKFSSNLNGPGNADQVILSDKFGGGGMLSDIIQSTVYGVRVENGLVYSTHLTYKTQLNPANIKPMTIFIEGLQISPNELDDINPFDVYSIEVLTSTSFLSVYGSNAPGGALIITLKHGSDSAEIRKMTVDGLITYTFNGFYKARQFYSPKYNAANTSGINDTRRTIYWTPDAVTGTNGRTSLEYFNAGSPGTYRVVVEGIDARGNLGRQVFRYKVE